MFCSWTGFLRQVLAFLMPFLSAEFVCQSEKNEILSSSVRKIISPIFFQLLTSGFDLNESCPADKICTTNVIHNSGICPMDYGGPLYAMYCQSRIAECLYGVASYSASWTVDVSDDLCSQTTVFASVVHLKEWISSVIYQSDFWFLVQADDQIFGD